jgi:cellulose synthase/poly-beta-1,6-N-acetylglucosamine synthase-like glycosyltransferase
VIPFPNAADPPPLSDSIAFLARHGINLHVLREATAIAERCGVEPDEALIRTGLVDEELVYRALAHEVGLPFLSKLAVHPMARFPEGVLSGVVPLAANDGGATVAYAPRGDAFGDLVRRKGRLSRGLAIATPSALREELIRARAEIIGDLAADGLARARPEHSARGGLSLGQALILMAATLALCVGLLTFRGPTWLWTTILLGIAFLGVTTIRLATIVERIAPEAPRLPRSDEGDLPIYTILVPLFREARVLPQLLKALGRIDYPRPKLDIKLVVEDEDVETRQALSVTDLPAWIEVIVAPPGQPRTKPRALNVALPLARGEFVTVYDAEDVPDPGQLRLAVEIFARSPPDVACLQARLVIDNTEDTTLTRLFTVEYAALFDVANPALARFDLPLPLGGTSNHLRRSVLQGLGGWDAWNVTEDADLGLRLAIAGYRIADLPSATLEEAPQRLRAWMRQRRRWMKGFLQVSVTHSRHPVTAYRRLGAPRFFGAVALSFGTVGSALGYPIFTSVAVYDLLVGNFLEAVSPAEICRTSIGTTLLVTGFLAMILPPLEALRRRRWWRLMPYALLMPLYYVLVSWAAWRGLIDLVFDPHRWHKTDHGLARTSRSGFVNDDRPTIAGAAPALPVRVASPG